MGITWRGEGKDPAAGCPRRAPGTAAGSSSGSAGGPLPGTSHASSRGHGTSEALVPLQREPPQAQHGGSGARAVHGNARGGAGSRWVRAPCAPHRESGRAAGCWRTRTTHGEGTWPGQAPSGHGSSRSLGCVRGVWAPPSPDAVSLTGPTASGPPGRCGAGADGSPCPARAARWQRGKQEAVLPCEVRPQIQPPRAGCALLWGTEGWALLLPRKQPRLCRDARGGNGPWRPDLVPILVSHVVAVGMLWERTTALSPVCSGAAGVAALVPAGEPGGDMGHRSCCKRGSERTGQSQVPGVQG